MAVVLSVFVAGVGHGSGAGNRGCAMVESDMVEGIVLLMLTGKKGSKAGPFVRWGRDGLYNRDAVRPGQGWPGGGLDCRRRVPG